MALHQPTPFTAPITLTSLPRELLTRVALLLDLSSALSLSLVCRSTASSAICRIWRDIDLVVQPHPDKYNLAAKLVESALHVEAERTRCIVLREKTKAVIGGGLAKWDLIREIKMAPRSGSGQGMALLLEAARHLRCLEFVDSNSYTNWLPHETIEFHLLTSRVHLPALTRLVLGDDSMRYAGLVPLLCNAASCLTELEVAFSEESLGYAMWAGYPLPEFPTFERATNIRRLSVSFHDPLDDKQYDSVAASPILSLLKHCPALQELILEYSDPYGNSADKLYAAVLPIIRDCHNLRDLIWLADARCFDPHGAGVSETTPAVGYASLQRALLVDCSPMDVFFGMPMFPQIETLYMTFSKSDFLTPVNGSRSSSSSSYTPTMLPSFRASLQGSPNLHTIRAVDETSSVFEHQPSFASLAWLDQMQSSIMSVLGRVRSIRHAGAEILHASCLSRMVEIRDSAGVAPRASDDACYVEYRAIDGSIRHKEYVYEDEARWRDYTDFEGRPVPLLVLEEMQRVEGASPVDWQGRDIEVRAEAWKVLTDWTEAAQAAGAGEMRV